jgi:hypothetical protein
MKTGLILPVCLKQIGTGRPPCKRWNKREK